MNTPKANRKSNNAVKIADKGMMRRGKYIFLIMFAFDTILDAAFIKPFEKIFQIIRPENAKIGYGNPSELTFKPRLKISVKSNIILRGCIAAHKMPKVACLYRTLMSRQVKK